MKIRPLYGILLAGIGCASVSKLNIITKPGDAKLYINTDAAYHYRINKSRLEGEQDLVDLIQTATVEEAWVFNKINYDWTEIGENEEPCMVSLKRIKEINPEDHIHYHIHPMQVAVKEEIIYAENLEGKLLLDLSDKNVPETTKENLNTYLLFVRDKKLELQAKLIASSVFPSFNDIMFMNVNSIESVIASEYGILDSKDLKKTIRMIDYSYEELWINSYMNLRENSDKWMQPKKGYTVNDVISAVTNNLNEKFKGELKFEFRPFTPHRILPLPSVPPLTSSRIRA